MAGEQSRQLKVGDKVCWQNDQADRGTVIEKNWSGLTIKWDSRGEQRVLHNDMGGMSLVARSEFDGDAFSVLIASATTEAVLRLKRQPPPRLGWRQHDELPARAVRASVGACYRRRNRGGLSSVGCFGEAAIVDGRMGRVLHV
jgi:hypothetical protein